MHPTGGSSASPRSIVVLGASGFIGQRVESRLAESGARVEGHSSSTCDLLDERAVCALFERLGTRDTVVFCAAIGRAVEDSPSAMWRNIQMVDNVVRAVGSGGLRSLVYLSSVDVYGRPPRTLPITEETPPYPTGYYGVSKIASEFLLNRLEGTVPVTVLRLPGVYGPVDRFRSVIGSFVRQIVDDEPVQLVDGGATLRDYVFVDDVADLVGELVERPEHELYNVATGDSRSVSEIAELVGAALGREPRLESAVGDVPSVGDLVFDGAKLRHAHPAIRLRGVERGIADYVATISVGRA